jgi:predicted ester cyclase
VKRFTFSQTEAVEAVSVEENKLLVRRFVTEVISGGDMAAADALMAPHYVLHFSGAPGPLDREGFKGFLVAFRNGFPDMRETVEDLVAEGDKVAVRGTTRGTHTGAFQGIAPTGREIEVGWTGIFRIADSRIVEDQVTFDNLGLMQQLGAIPPAPGA